MSQQTVSATWHHTLEEWTQRQFGHWERLPHARPVQFAPFEAHRPEPFYALPVTVFVLTARTRAFHAEFVQAVDLVRISTAAFRPVLFTDTARTPALSASDWPIEQCLPEALIPSEENWLDSAAGQLKWAQKHFGATYVFAPRSTEEAAELLRELSAAYNAEPAILAAGQARLAQTSVTRNDFGPTGRGPWEDLPEGTHLQNFATDVDRSVALTVDRISESRGVIVSGDVDTAEALHRLGALSEWSRVRLNEPSPSNGDAERTILRAGAQALSNGGPVIRCGTGATDIGEDAALTSTDGGRRFELKLGTRIFRFPDSAAGRVLETFARESRR